MNSWLKHLRTSIALNNGLVVITIIATKGSTPCTNGDKIVYTSNDAVFGSIGGGNLEFKALSLAKEMLELKGNSNQLIKYPLGATLGQCCGGYVKVLFESFVGNYSSLKGEDSWVEKVSRYYIESEDFILDSNHKIKWMENPIAFISKGRDYLNPKLELMVDEGIDLESKEKLKINLEEKLKKNILSELSDLVNLSKVEFKNNYVRALCYQLFEKNGVMKRKSVNEIIKNISKEDRSELRKAGVKIGRYHIFLPKMLKPSAVELRVKLWKLYFSEDKKYIIPKSGLNFLKDEIIKNNKFLLICGFENFGKFYVRVDILERLFLKIIENTKNGIFKIDSNMINLIGCSKENFFKLLDLMEYKPKKIEGDKDDCFIYKPKFQRKKMVKNNKNINKDNPFDKLSELRFR